MMENINPYNKVEWKNHFTTTDLYNRLSQDFNLISFEHFVEHTLSSTLYTPRKLAGTSIFSGTIFYYIDYLLKDNPNIIYDIGCGWNIFKKYFPVYGIDPHGVEADQKTKHLGGVLGKHVMSINSLHFRPLSEIKNIVLEFMDTIESGGRGFLSLNIARMINSTINNTSEKYIRSELYEFKDQFLVFDLNLTLPNAYFDGNLRMVIQK